MNDQEPDRKPDTQDVTGKEPPVPPKKAEPDAMPNQPDDGKVIITRRGKPIAATPATVP